MRIGRGKIKGWVTKTVHRLFRFKRKQEETWAEFAPEPVKRPGKYGYIWFYLFCEAIAESVLRAMEWVCDERPNAVINTLKKRCQVEKYKMVAKHAEMEAQVGVAQSRMRLG